MNYDDLNFTIMDKNGNEVLCDIISIIPNPKEDNSSFVVFTDDSKDEDDNIIFIYGKLKSVGDEYELSSDVTESELSYIKKMLGPSISKQILQSLYEKGE